MASILAALAQVKEDYSSLIDAGLVERLCREAGHEWRDRELDPATTVGLFVQQVMHGNVPCQELTRLSAGRFSASGYCQARRRLPLQVLEQLNAEVARRGAEATAGVMFRWRGHRTFLGDGSSFSMSDTPELQEYFGQPTGQAPGCGFPVAHMLMMFDAQTGLAVAAEVGPMHRSDLADTPALHGAMQPGDLLIGDTFFGSYGHLALLLQGRMHGLFPVHQKRIVDFTAGRGHVKPTGGKATGKKGKPRSRWVKTLGRDDQLVEWFKPAKRPAWMSQEQWEALPASVIVREVRRRVRMADGRRVPITVVTTLLDAVAYPARELVRLMGRRWEVEVNLRHLKTTMGMEVLRCKTVEGVKKEWAVYRLVYNLVCLVLLEASGRQGVPLRRLSFADAWYWLRHACPGEPMPPIKVNPHRPDRLEPRAVKRRSKQHDLLNKPRDEMRKDLLRHKLTA
jgi:hypothetical protein